jgi:hypothetical protein
MRVKRKLAITWVIVFFAVVVLWSMTDQVEAADRDIFGDWDITSGIAQVTDETIDVRGNVIVRSGATLKLTNCDLAINGSGNGDVGLDVREGGRLEVYNSVLYGNNGRATFELHSDTIIEGSTIHHIYGSGWDRGIVADGGTFSIKDSIVRDSNSDGMDLQTDTIIENVTISQVSNSNIYIVNWGADAAFTITVQDSHMIGTGATGYYIAGIFCSNYGSGEQVDLLVKNTRFDNIGRGVYFSSSSKLDISLEGNYFTSCNDGIVQSGQSTSGTVKVTGNTVDGEGESGSNGITLTLNPSITLTLTDNVVKNLGRGHLFNGPNTGYHTESFGIMDITNCDEGIVADRQSHLTIHNSTVTDISDTYGSFIANGGSTITVIDTEHRMGSGTISGGGSWIRAYTEVEILGARWKDGNAITKGDLILENLTQVEVARINLSQLAPQDVIGWELDSTGRRTSQYLYPALYEEGYGFRGERFDIWMPAAQSVELVDDYAPSLEIEVPADGTGYAVATLAASGTYDELGSGLLRLEYSLDGANPIPFTSYPDGTWILPLSNIPEGEHTLAFVPVDNVGNVGQSVTSSFWVDTVLPFIDLDPFEALVNTTNVSLSGSTEPLVSILLLEQSTDVEDDGTFQLNIALKEGDNYLALEFVDKAGNTNQTTIKISRDTIFPRLVITSPETDIWTSVRNINVEGITDDDVDLTVAGTDVPVVNSSFRRRVELESGTFTIHVTAADKAGNTAYGKVTLFVDWTPPVLFIVEPEESEVFIRESTFYLTGDVDDPTIDHVMVNDQSLPLTSGRFVKQFTLLEGTNEYHIHVVDAAGNTASALVVAIRDLTPPTYESDISAMGGELIYKEGNLYSTAPAVEVHLMLDELANVTVEGDVPHPATTDIRIRFDLQEGVNDLVLHIVDRAGNQANSYRERVIVDTTAPSITLYEPMPGDRTKEDTTIVHGVTQAGSTVTIDGTTVTLLTGGEFRHVVALVDGKNDFTIEVEDAMGNTNSTTFSILRDSEVTDPTTSTSGSTAMGFLAGLVVGILGMAAFIVVRGRRAEAPQAGPKAHDPSPKGEEPSEPSEEKGPSEWEEY